MGWPHAHFSWRALRCLGRAQFYLSLLGLLFSLSLLGWAWTLKIQLGDHMELAQPGDGYLWPATVVIVVVFVLPVHLTAIALRPGICRDLESKRALRASRDAGKSMDRLLFLHVLLSCLSGILVLSTCAGSVFYWSNTRRRLKQGLLKALRRYPLDKEIQHGVDRLQMELHCCGVNSYRDWFYLPWTQLGDDFSSAKSNDPNDRGNVNESKAARQIANSQKIDSSDYYEEKRGPLVSSDVPYSCCLVDILRECVHRELLTSELQARSEPTISRVGCQVKILGRADDAGRDLMACLLFLTVYQLTLSILSRLLQTARWSALSHETCGEPQYEAWLFGVKGQLAPARYSELRMLQLDNDQDYSASSTTSDFDGLDCDPAERYRDFGRLKGGRDTSYNDDDYKSCEADDEEHQPKSNGHFGRFKSSIAASKGTLGRSRYANTSRINHQRQSAVAAATSQRNRQQSLPKKLTALSSRSCIISTSSLSSRSCSLPPMPSTPQRRPKVTTQTSSDIVCPLHRPQIKRQQHQCPVHPEKKLSTTNGSSGGSSSSSSQELRRARCPVHGVVNRTAR